MKQFIVALALVLTSSLALAESPTWGNQAGDNKVSDAKTTDANATAAKGAPKSPRGERMQNDLGLTDEQVKKMREIRDAGGTREEMQAVLTPEQRAKAMQLRKARKADQEERMGRMQKELGLTDEQQAKMDEIRKNHGSREEMRAVLTPEQQQKFDAMRSKRKGAHTSVKPAGSTVKPTATPTVQPSGSPSVQPAGKPSGSATPAP